MKNNKILLYGALLGTGLYLYLRMKKNTVVGSTGSAKSTATDETVVEESVGLSKKDKNNLFVATLGYQGGAKPSKEMQERFRIASLEAKAKIEKLGLMEEFKAWRTERRKQTGGGFQFPMSVPTGMDVYEGGRSIVPMSDIPLKRR